MSSYLSALCRSAVGALRPSNARWALGPAAWAVATAALIAGTSLLVGNLRFLGLAFLGAACAVSFLSTGLYRARWWAVTAQAIGGALGISAGAVLWPGSAAALVMTAAGAGAISGMVGGIGPSATAFAMMLSVGVAFGQFGGSPLPWPQQVVWYLIGSALAAVGVLVSWALRRDEPERREAAALFDAAADLCEAIGTEQATSARARLAAASARVRPMRDRRRSDLVALAAATLYAQRRPVPKPAVAAIRLAGSQVRAGQPISVEFTAVDDPGLMALADALSNQPVRPGTPLPAARRFSSLLRTATSETALANGARIGLCQAVATGITVAMHQPEHSFWLPLTSAVIVRPEYASIFVRTVNRIVGTLLGALMATAFLAVYSSGFPVVVAAALMMGFAVLAAPKLYALSVIGITSAALLSQSIGQPDPVAPGIRLVDTIIGAAVAVVFGYLVWPGARRLPGSARLTLALAAARGYLEEAVKPAPERRRYQAVRDDAYQLAHRVRDAAQAAVLEPPPVNTVALQIIPFAMEMEDTVDAITAVGAAVNGGGDCGPLIDDVNRRLAGIERAASYPR
ncbi:FUSC family protein [Mycobacterium sp. ML4]